MVKGLVLGMIVAVVTLSLGGTAWAGSPRGDYCPPNEIPFVKALIKAGVVPRSASSAEPSSVIEAVLSQRSKPEDRAFNKQRAFVAPRDSQLTAWGRTIRNVLRSGKKKANDNVLVILVQFSNDPATTFKGAVGPMHGQIPSPGKYDNATYWPGDFSRAHYQNMLFGSSYPIYGAGHKLRGITTATMKDYFWQQSARTYLVDGKVVGWVTLPHPEKYYGEDSRPFVDVDDANGPVWRLTRDAVAQFAAENPGFPWAKYDRKNPFGIAGDDPDVPDGYVDHLVIVHAGVDESAGGGAQGPDSIWAHSSWVDELNGLGPGGAGGYQVPGTAIWVGPYTCDPEDGAAGVFCHEFAHDLGLPDQYDTTYSGESPTGFWTLMDNGSWGGKTYGLGYRPGGLMAWERMALGWTTPIEVKNGHVKTITLDGAALGNPKKVAIRIPAPESKHVITLDGGSTPAFWSTMGDDLNTILAMKDAVTVPSDPAAAVMSISTWYEIESGYDYGFVEVSADGGTTWRTVRGSATEETSPGSGIWGLTGDQTSVGSVSYDLSAFAGQAVKLRFRYATDPGVAYRGWEIFSVTLGSRTWSTADGSQFTGDWIVVTGTYTAISTQYYMAEYRNWAGYDTTLRNVYQIKDVNATRVDWYPYSQGLLLVKRDTFYPDNSTANHPGNGGWLPVDAHPYPDTFQSVPEAGRSYPSLSLATAWRSRVQSRDAAFSRMKTPAVTLSSVADTVGAQTLPGRPASAVFDDSWVWWSWAAPEAGVLVPEYGLHISVKKHTKSALTVRVDNPELPAP